MAQDPGSRYINRELSWLDFNLRVLEEAEKATHPLLERLKFLSIVSSNLDEFFMVRVAGLKQQIEADFIEPDPTGLTPRQQLKAVAIACHSLVERQYRCWHSLLALLRQQGITLVRGAELSSRQGQWLDHYFEDVIYPVLTPLAVSATQPFPPVTGRRMYLGIRLHANDTPEDRFALVQVPPILPRAVQLPETAEGPCFILLEDVLLRHLGALFVGYTLQGVCLFRLTRDGDLTINEDADDLMVEIRKSLTQRRWGQGVRLEIMEGFDPAGQDPALLSFLLEQLGCRQRDIYYIAGPVDLTFLMGFSRLPGYDSLRDAPQPPLPPMGLDPEEDLFAALRTRDVLVHTPYESFNCVIDLLSRAASDPDVLAIKQTLYRVGGQSPVVEALIRAAEAGKQVTVLVELKARFDEENNIAWAQRLEQAGCQVIYGLVGLKVHCKVLLVVRREEDGIRRYVHFSTGNYNETTARLYSDLGLFTSSPAMGADASALFNLLTGFSAPPLFHKIAVAPTGLRAFFYHRIDEEIRHAQEGRPAHIIAKVNSLIDPGLIDRLYAASAAGVKIELIVRGVCGLRPGIKNLSENIRVTSIVGRYLEHHRIFYFADGGRERFYLSSADWMPRNLDRRVEVCFPVEQADLVQRLRSLLELYLADTVGARLHLPDGRYIAIPGGNEPVSSQQRCYEEVRSFWQARQQRPPRFVPRLPEETGDGDGNNLTDTALGVDKN